MNIDAIQSALCDQKLDGWLFYDHHHRDPIAYRILGLSETMHVTRRWYYFIPAEGEPRKLVHRVEQGRLDTLPGEKGLYSSWGELEEGLQLMLTGYDRIAMQYSPRNAIMYVSMVDAGTIEVLREFRKSIVSSANLVSQFEAVLSEEQIRTHYEAQVLIDEILAEAFREIAGIFVRRMAALRVRSPSTTWFSGCRRRCGARGLEWENGPNVSINENSSDSHYEPTAATPRKFSRAIFS